MNNPKRSISSASNSWLALAAGMTLAAAALGVWAFAPLRSAFVPPALSHPSSAGAAGPDAKPPFDASVFKVAIYNPVPPPPAPQAHSVAAAAPLKLQLIGIIGAPTIGRDAAADGSAPQSYKAALYDPEADELYILSAGERIGTTDHTVKAVAATSVEIADGRGGMHVLRLDAVADASREPGRGASASDAWFLAPHAEVHPGPSPPPSSPVPHRRRP